MQTVNKYNLKDHLQCKKVKMWIVVGKKFFTGSLCIARTKKKSKIFGGSSAF